MRQCQNVFNELVSSPSQYRPQLVVDPRTQPPLMNPPQQRLHIPAEASLTGSRVIQPRPSHIPRFAADDASSPYSPTSSESQARRRGRPNRVEAERRKRVKEEAAARGDKDPYPTRPRKKARTQQPAAETVGAIAPPSGTPVIVRAASTSSISNPGASAFHTSSGPYASSSTSSELTLAPILSTSTSGLGGGFTRTRSERSALTNIGSPGSFATPFASTRPSELSPASLPPEQQQQQPDRLTQRSPHHESRPPPTTSIGQPTESESSQQRQSSQAQGDQMEQ